VDKNEVMIDLLETWASIRAYTDEELSEEQIRKILQAGRRSPSGENAQPWVFIVVKDPETRKKLGVLSKRGSGRRFTGEYVTKKMQERFSTLTDLEKQKRVFEKLTSGNVSAFVGECPVLIIIAGNKKVWDTPYDCSAAAENMLLMAHSMGVGGCWVNAATMDIRDEVILKETLAVPDDYKILSIFTFGKPKMSHKPRMRKPLESIVFAEKFGQKYYEGGDK